MSDKICTRNRCKRKGQPQPADQFVGLHGGVTHTCRTCREYQAQWAHDKTMAQAETPDTLARYFAGMVIRRKAGEGPRWLG